MTSLREIFESDNWIITEILQGYDNRLRIKAKKRFANDTNPVFCEWGSLTYLNKLSIDNYGKKINQFNTFKY
jgi:hypothetical protein